MQATDEGHLEFDPDGIAPGGFPVRFGRYELNGLLGDGATARVFRAHLLGPANFRKPVALKIVLETARKRSGSRELLFDEARIGGRLVHPNLVETYDVGEHGGRLYVAMQLVDGLTARQMQRQAERLTPRAVLELVRQMADGLAHAHALQVDGRAAQLVHRDLKPANVLIGRDGIARIADFGIARALGLTDSAPEGAIWGTLGYMSPEQAFGRGATQSSDVFALGIMMAEFAMGRRFAPVKDLPAYVMALKELGGSQGALPPVIDAVVPGLGRIAARCLRLVPAERYPNGREVAAEIAELPVPGGRGLATQMQQLLGDDAPAPPPPPRPVDISAPPSALSPEVFADPAPAGSAGLDPSIDESIATIVTQEGMPSGIRPREVDPDRPFVGRDAVRRRLVLRLSEGDRLVSLVGQGGVGKTRLAQVVADALAEQFVGGVWHCELADVRTPEALLATVAGLLNVPLSQAESRAGFAARLGHALADRGALLLVLDSFEHLVDCAEEILGTWLRVAPEARLLVTARERLRLDADEFVERLEPLAPAEARALFVALAFAHHPDLRFDAAATAEIDALVARLDGLPLAIELAAAHANELDGTGALADRLGVLLDAAPARGGRRGTLRATLDWSWGLLQPWERDALAQLTVFRGGFTLEAVQAVVDLSAHAEAPFPLYVLESLLEYSWVRVEPPVLAPGAGGGSTVAEASEARFGLYRAGHAYAAERLAAHPEEEAAARARHAAWFARFGEPAWVRALDTRGGIGRRWALAREHENLTVAAEHALAGFDAECAAGVVLALGEAAPLCGRHEPARLLAQQVLAMDAPPRLRAWLALRLGYLWYDVAQADMALAIAQSALRMAQAEGDEPLAVRALDLVAAGEMEGTRQRPDAALAACDEGLSRAELIPDRVARGILLGRRGAIELAVGNAGAAADWLQQAVQVHREVGNGRAEIADLRTLGRALLAQGRLAEAARTLKAGVIAAREIGDPQAEAQNLHPLAELSLLLGRGDDALRLAERAFQLYRDAGNTRQACLTEGLLAEVHAARGDMALARSLLEQAIEVCDALQHGAGMGLLRATLATVTAREGDPSTARYLLKAAESFLRESGDREGLARMLCIRGHIECDAVNLVGAWTAYNEARGLATQVGAGADAPLGRALARLSAELTES
jgi:serine/threonine protein kinase/predicted ATPase